MEGLVNTGRYTMPLQFADRLNNVETSAIRELFKLLGKPGIISFAGGFPDPAMFDVEGIREAVNAALTQEPGAALQYGATEGYNPLREQLAAFMASKGCSEVAPDNMIVTTGSQQALDLLVRQAQAQSLNARTQTLFQIHTHACTPISARSSAVCMKPLKPPFFR
jgi:DNA-binding transcriptional MocR family regulator